MPYFAVHAADGALVSWGTQVADDATLAEKGYTAKRFTGGNQPPEGKQWNPSTLAFDQDAPRPQTAEERLAADKEFAALTAGEQRLARVLLRTLR